MVRKPKYSSRIKDMGLLTRELKIAAAEFIRTGDYDSILTESIHNNIFQVKTERRRKELAMCLINRLYCLDEYATKRLVEGALYTANTLAFLALIKSDILMFEFMNEVYKDKVELMLNSLTEVDFNQFIDCKAQQSELINRWKESNKTMIKAAMRNILIDAGMIKDMGRFYAIFVPVLDNELTQKLLEDDNQIYLSAMGVRT